MSRLNRIVLGSPSAAEANPAVEAQIAAISAPSRTVAPAGAKWPRALSRSFWSMAGIDHWKSRPPAATLIRSANPDNTRFRIQAPRV
jgi:hypothetical protein